MKTYVPSLNLEKWKKKGIAPHKSPDNITHNDNETKANIFNTHFASSFSNPGDKDISINLNKIEELGNINIEEKGINKLLAGLKQNKASGPDDIPARLLKELNNESFLQSSQSCFRHQ